MPRIYLDGLKREVPDGTRISDLIPDKPDDVSIAVIRPLTVSKTETQQYLFKTTVGDIIVETSPLAKDLFSPESLKGLLCGWQDSQVSSFGPFPSSISPSKNVGIYNRGDLVLGCGGYDQNRSYLIFCKKTHKADHGAPLDGGVIGTVVSGVGIIDRFSRVDSILSIEPVISFDESSDAFTTTDTKLPVEDGMQIVTHITIEAAGYSSDGKGRDISVEAAESVEFMLLSLLKKRFIVDMRLSTHIRCDNITPATIPPEVNTPRTDGAVVMRTMGKKRGSLYIYTKDLSRSIAHTTVGQVVSGLELAKIAKNNDRLQVEVIPEKFDLIGMSVAASIEKAKAAGIAITVANATKLGEPMPDSVVIEQNPPTTLEVLSKGFVSVTAVPYIRVLDIKLDYINAPDTVRIFREATGLKYHDIGAIPLLFNFDEVFLFSATIPKTVNVNPENLPKDNVPKNMLAMTNDSCKGVGTVGVRTVESSEFGPTSEEFTGTNIIGSVFNSEILEGLDDGDMVYFREVF